MLPVVDVFAVVVLHRVDLNDGDCQCISIMTNLLLFKFICCCGIYYLLSIEEPMLL